MPQHVGQSEAELDFGIKLEKRQEKGAAQSQRQIGIHCVELEEIASFFADIQTAHYAESDIWPGIHVAVARYLKVERHYDISAFYILCLHHVQLRLAKMHRLVAEIHAGAQAQVEMLVQPQVGQNVDTEPRAVGRHLGIPVFPLGRGVPVVCEFQVLEMGTYREPEVKPFLVCVQAVADEIIALCRRRHDAAQQEGRHSHPPV